jgi:hypothetical protein
MSDATSLIQRQLGAYNAQNLDAMVQCYAPECVIAGLNGAIMDTRREALPARYAKAFAAFPENKATLVNRIAVGNSVNDHAEVSRGPGKEQLQIIAIRTVMDGSIVRVDLAK